jgi:LuxR family transcriptional regulator, maltose regulon positive regulatory protein
MVRDDRQSPDSYELLSTKLTPPQSRGPLVPRDRLLARLDAGLEQKVTLISAPAGFGKTTLASEWIAARRQQNRMPPLAWVSLDSGDNDPVRFWRYALSACRAFGAEVSEPALSVLNYSPQPPFEALLTMLINKLAQLSGKVVLALEDYHAITSQQIHQTMAFFVDNFPPALHLLLMTRSDPPLPLARLRAYNELNELRAPELRFTAEEIQDFLELAMPHPLPAQVAASVAERTEGWAAGLRLVALAVQRMPGQDETEQYLTSFTGSHRPVLDYLVSEGGSMRRPCCFPMHSLPFRSQSPFTKTLAESRRVQRREPGS